jgi:Secretion system C-terminal sorting domain
MEKRVLWIALFFSVAWVGFLPGDGLRAQCTGGVEVGVITPTVSWQTIPCIRAGEYYRFFATAGLQYTFSTCQGGGQTTYDTQISILDDATGLNTPGGYANGGCGLGDHLWKWSVPATGWYRVLLTKVACTTDTRCAILAYHQELDPLGGPGRTCGNPWIAPSIPFLQTGLTTCNYDNDYGSNVSCPSTYMSGPDFVIKFSGTAGQCISIYTQYTFTYTGLFLFNGCPNIVGSTCVAYVEGASVNPQMTNINLPTTGDYYLIVDTKGSFRPCTSFDINIVPCVAAGQGSNCATAFTIPSIPYNQVGFTTCGRGNTYNSTMACASTFMNGEDFMFKYTSPGNECVNITLSLTYSNTAFFVYNGCPNVVGTTCIASRTSTSGNPKLRDIQFTAPGTYYIMVSTLPSPTCTPFDFKIEPCPPPCARNPNMANTCGAPQAVSLGLNDTICGHTSLSLTPDTSPDLIADFCGSIENNGWFSFVADSTVMTFRVNVTNCLSGAGIQARVFETTDCINFTPKSVCFSPMMQASGNIQATGLTVGNTYLFMFDGYNGDDCDIVAYRIKGNLPVVWSHFSASLRAPHTVSIDWSTTTEINNRGFYVQRGFQRTKGGEDNFEWQTLGFVEPKGQPGQGADYTFTDQPEYLGRPWYYRVQQVDFDGVSDFTPYQEIMIEGAPEPSLYALFPNPATHNLTLEYYAAKPGRTSLAIYSMGGMLVKQQNFDNSAQGILTESINVDQMPNGLYFYVLSIDGKFFKGKLEVLH